MKKKRKQRRRAGRVRRWVVRPTGWIIAVVVILFGAAVVYLDSSGFADRLRRTAERRLTAALGRNVVIGRLELDLLPLAVTVEDVSIAGPEPAAAPLFTLARGMAEIELSGVIGRRVELSHLHLLRPSLEIGFDEEGRSDLPRFTAPGGKPGAEPVVLRFGTLEIEAGELVVDDDRTPLDLTARELEAVFTGVGDGIELRGRALTPDLGLILPPGRPYEAELEVRGVIRPHRFDVVRASLAGPDLAARATGYWRWQGDREVALDLEANGDLAVLGRLGYLEGLLDGAFVFNGELTRKPGVFLVDGDVTSPRATAFERDLADLEARLHVDTNTLALDIVRARHGGGDVTGSVGLGLAVDPGRVDLELRLDRVGIGRLLSDLRIPIEGVSGGVSGAVSYQFDSARPDAGNGWADLVVTDARVPRTGAVPLTGTIPLTIGAGVVRSRAVRITAPGFRLTGAGDFDLASGGGLWSFEIDADEVAQAMRLVPGARDGEPAPWRPTSGSGRADGELELSRAGASLRLVLDLADIVAPGLEADRVSGLVALDGAGLRELRLDASRPGAALLVNGSIPFAQPAPGAAVFPLEIALDAAAWPLEEARPWLPFELPVSGPYTGSVEIEGPGSGAADGVSGGFSGRVAPVARGGLVADSLTVDARFDPSALRLERADLELAGGTVGVTGSVGWETLALDLEIATTELDPATLDAVPAGVADGLAARLVGTVGGRLERPEVAARLEWTRVEAEPVDLEWRDGRLRVHGAVPGLVEIDGGGALAPEEVDLELELTDGRVAELARRLAPDIGLEGELAGRLRVSGSYQGEADLAATLRLDRLALRLPSRPGVGTLQSLANLEPVVVEIDGDGVRVRSLYLADQSATSEIFLGGRIGFDGGLDLQLQTAIASDWLAAAVDRVWPGARWSGGGLDAIATIEGTFDSPRLNGVGEVRGARLVAEGLPAALEDLSGIVLFYRDQIVVDSVTARMAGGSVRAGGVVPLGGDAEDPVFRFQAVGERLSYRSPDGWTARGGGEVVLTSTPDGVQLTGGVVLSEVLYVKNVKLGLEQLVEGLFGSQRLEVVPAEGWRAATQLNLRIEGNRALRVRNNVADLRGSADLVLRGTLARPVVFGTVEVEPGGRLEYAGADYRVERGQLTFTNPYRIEPAIDLLAYTELREYDVTLSLSGTLDRLELDFTSNPPLPDLDVLGLLSGSPGSALPEESREGGSVSAQSFLYGQATTLLAQRFNRLFGLDKFRIDPLTSAAGNVSSARVTIGKRLTRNLSVTYSYDPASTEEQVLELDWNVTRYLSLLLTQNGDGTYAVDALWEKAF